MACRDGVSAVCHNRTVVFLRSLRCSVVLYCRSDFVLCTSHPIVTLEGDEWLSKTVAEAGASLCDDGACLLSLAIRA